MRGIIYVLGTRTVVSCMEIWLNDIEKAASSVTTCILSPLGLQRGNCRKKATTTAPATRSSLAGLLSDGRRMFPSYNAQR